ncbi:hypothetical protein ACFRMQ_36000 [Kitasatospora sp. NPDC056783]|uniref:hypothetical protein n=1 Tax=Kitasatospora sp. NPDC056783 TaxID=3345943 RepID=UPI0036BE30D8
MRLFGANLAKQVVVAALGVTALVGIATATDASPVGPLSAATDTATPAATPTIPEHQDWT